MSGTPSISESYAVLGHSWSEGSRFDLRVSLVVLTRGPALFRPQVLTDFQELGFFETLCVETGSLRYDVAALVRQLPGLRVMVHGGTSNPGRLVNLAAREVRGDRFLVVWDDQTIPEQGLYSRVQTVWQQSTSVAVVPELRDRQGRELPSVLVPGLEKDRLKILALGTDQENVDTLFAPDYTALYERRRFLRTGGYDTALANPFWQKVDWGLRSRLWGETLTVERAFNVDYCTEPPVEDQTPDRSYPRFFLRNLAVRHAGDHGVLPFARFWAHARRAGLPWSESLVGFLREREWVKTNRYRFRTDARLLTELWGTR